MPNKSKPSSGFQSGATPQKKKPKLSTQRDSQATNSAVSHNSDTLTVTQSQQAVTAMTDQHAWGSPAGAAPGAVARGVGSTTSPRSSGTAAPLESDDKLQAPAWFRAFEARLESRFEVLLAECQEKHASMELEIANLKDEVDRLSVALKKADEKVDDIENRSRRNNIVVFNVPEKSEGGDCVGFVCNLLKDAGCPEPEVKEAIQRAHRSGRLSREENPRPRPIHVGFSTYLHKEKARKSLIDLFKLKDKKKNDNQGRLCVSDDYSRRVQLMRKEKLPQLIKLKKEGKNAFMVYPATIRVRDSATGATRDV